MFGLDRGDVAADDDRGTGRQTREQALHALTEIALALRHAGERLARRREGRCDIAVGIDGEQRAPAPVLRKPQRRVRQTVAIEADRGDIADLARRAAA